MKKAYLSIILILLINPLINATLLNIGNDENNLSSFQFNNLKERIEIKGNEALIKDWFLIHIDKNNSLQSIPIFLEPSTIRGREIKIKNPSIIICSADQHNSVNDIVNSSWGLNCINSQKEYIEGYEENEFFRFYLNLSKINWGNYMESQEFRDIFIQIEYNVEDFVIENEGE